RPLEFLDPTVLQKPVPRKLGLGEVNRRRLNRAEKLISIGFLEMGMRELAQVTRGENNQEFLFYLAKMFKKAGGFQRAIHLSWGISSKRNHQALSQSLVEILFPKVYLDRAAEESSRYQISPYLVLGLMRQESAFNRKIVSSARAVGLMQLLPSTAKTVARSMGTRIKDEGDLKKPEINIQLGVKYLSGLLDEFQDNVVLALASYNAGPYKVKLWMDHRSMLKPLEFMESIPYRETRNYVKKVLRNYVIYKTLYGKGKIKALRDIFSVRN
ncbi:MAG: transglycosylase SLT domain-containing protein, partial [Nitrospinaceae bacterium]|nr:transglycosylase SLT domain-containing protein [Nitrospinaceae bacterium]NIX35468.1 transglycosylase SLT domain-containing protein [Nitrospinaceae bacterium]